MKIYMVRHGETEWNREGRYYGVSDVGLTEQGLAQARRLGVFLRKMQFDRVIVSPLRRAQETAGELTDQKWSLDERLMEQNFGIFEGLTYRELSEKYPIELRAWETSYEDYPIPEGESFSMVRERVDDFTEELWTQSLGEARDETILIVAHKGTLGHMLASFMHLPKDGYWNFVFEQDTYSQVDLQDGYAILRTVNRPPLLEDRADSKK